ncbi:hypothetical protein S7711_10231 [Stachybotrys chartarum IBT 7711]|uniref:BAH domain-containing protein n=1 Tax=Stachybotrys chartarum (strain CBS 109288 / IBT 7711) TaxID=1280523 RepID=A0A084B547_STACB|nr:hypothetical protein S7711_10231 [Stachybotrys chartarum IBT 7711]
MGRPRKPSSFVAENRAECPFKVAFATNPINAERRRSKRQKRESLEDNKTMRIQTCPFAPTGKFKTNETMDLYYTITPNRQWLSMTRYNSFVPNLGLVNDTKYQIEDFVHVANDATIERQKAAANIEVADRFRKAEDDWVARILEIRAADEHHVYARVIWMYSPDELPKGTIDGKRFVEGRQPYHGQTELIASNHMDIINVFSVSMPATVKQWIEADEDEIREALYWRQAFDCLHLELSSVELICKCEMPANPDKTLIGCTNPACGKWLHYECLLDDVLTCVHERLGQGTPHITKQTGAQKEDKDAVWATQASSPMEAKQEATQPIIDVREGVTLTKFVQQTNEEPPQRTEIDTTEPWPSARNVASKPSSKGKANRTNIQPRKPYQGLFEAALEMREGPTRWKINDLRANVPGGKSNWTESARCLICNVVID